MSNLIKEVTTARTVQNADKLRSALQAPGETTGKGLMFLTTTPKSGMQRCKSCGKVAPSVCDPE